MYGWWFFSFPFSGPKVFHGPRDGWKVDEEPILLSSALEPFMGGQITR